MVKHLPQTVAATRYFSANQAAIEAAKSDFPLHPRQPLGLKPQLSTALQVDNLVSMSEAPLSRREAMKRVIPLRTEGDGDCGAAAV